MVELSRGNMAAASLLAQQAEARKHTVQMRIEMLDQVRVDGKSVVISVEIGRAHV